MKNDETLCLELSSTLNVEENLILNIKYTGTINNQLRGFFHFKCNGIERFSAATMFEVCCYIIIMLQLSYTVY